MSRTFSSDRPYVRRRRAAAGAEDRSPGRLAALAGAAARPAVERLEPRQMLFSLTITPDSAGPDGLGTASAVFGYHIPVLDNPEEIDDEAEPDTVTEAFEQLPDDAVPPENIPTGTQFEDSGLRVTHTVQPPSDFQVDAEFNAENEPIDGTERLDIQLDDLPGGPEQFTFAFDADEDAETPFQSLPLDALSFDAGTPDERGLPFNNINVVVTLAGGEEVTIPAGAAVQNLNQFPYDDGDGNDFANGRGTFEIDEDTPGIDSAFTSVRFEAADGGSPNEFSIDNVQATSSESQFTPLIENRQFAAEVRFRGPVGASVQVLDLFGRDMVATLNIGVPDGADVPLSDLDKDGIPDFNDGIGEIILRNTDSRSSLSIWGGEFDPSDLTYERADSFTGLLDEFEDRGLGFATAIDDDGNLEISGLPPTQGSVILGAPFERDLDFYNVGGNPADPGVISQPDGAAIVEPDGFSNPDQGVKVLDGSAMGRVTVHGLVFGSSQFTGTLEDFNVGSLYGSANIAGDLGSLTVAVDAGAWTVDPGFTPTIQEVADLNKTGSELVVGRTAREVLVGGRSVMDITVEGDLDSPGSKPPRDALRYEENEHVNPIPEDVGYTEEAFIGDFLVTSPLDTNPGAVPEIDNQARLFGTNVQRNDTILSAEWIGSAGSAVEVTGQIGYGDPAVNTSEDPADVFAFASDGTGPVEILSSSGAELRVLDQEGRTVGALEQFSNAEDSQRLSFDPSSPGVYYLVVSDPGGVIDGDFDGTAIDYRLSVSGLAPTTFGSYRTGASSGNADGVAGVSNTVNVLNGSVGAVRVGTAFVTGDGETAEPFTDILNTTADDVDAAMNFGAGTFSMPGDLHAIVAGSDIEPETIGEPVSFTIGGNLGSLYTGQSSVAGTTFTDGDVAALTLDVAGNVGTIDVNGAVGIDQDSPDDGVFGNANFRILTGTDGSSRGDIGLFRVGSTTFGNGLRIDTPDDAVIGGLLFNQDIGDEPDGSGEPGIRGTAIDQMITTGFGADVRFVDLPQIDLNADTDALQPLTVGQTVEVTDDAGASVRITVNGIGQGTSAGLIRLLPIDSSQGTAIAQIEADLSGNRSLDIESVGTDGEAAPISIGRVELTDSTPQSSISVTGPVPIDIWRIEDDGGTGLDSITNDTPGGDIVAADVGTLNTLTIEDGNLGLTELPAFGPGRIGPDLTLGSGLSGDVGEPIGILAEAIEPAWNGQIYRPTDDAVAGDNAFLDDLGGPMDGFLDGLIVRAGDVQNVQVSGAIADVILQGAGAELVNAAANTDNEAALGDFDGIVGSVYAAFIERVEVGAGLAAPAQGPIATTGIFATDEVRNVEAGETDNADIAGYILASDLAVQADEVGGIDNVDVSGGGSITGAHIAGTFLDGFWEPNVPVALVNPVFGAIDNISIDGGDLVRTIIEGTDVNNVEITDGFYDATQLSALQNVDTISATGYRNSTITGTDREFRANFIEVGQNLGTLTTEESDGEVRDLRLDVNGDVTESINAGDFTRFEAQVDNEVAELIAEGGIRGSNIVAGDLPMIEAGETITASRFRISGALESLIAGAGIRNADIGVTGPNGRIDLLEAPSISGVVTASGPIDTIVSTSGDIDIELTTTTDRGVVGVLSAARDLVLDSDISAGVNTLHAGRHVGDAEDPGVILIKGDLTRVSAPNGQLYNDVRAGGTIGLDMVTLPDGSTGGSGIGGGSGGGGGDGQAMGVTLGRATHLTGSSNLGRGEVVAFDRIGPVVVNGDFGGSVISHSGGLQSVAINNGSLLPGGEVSAFSGDVEGLTITNGHLLGDVHADFNIASLQVVAGSGGTFGDVGVNPQLAATDQADNFRNELPLGVTNTAGADGPSITAGRRIVDMSVGGSVFETAIHAGRRIANISIAGDATADPLTQGQQATSITAGDRINIVTIGGNLADTLVAAGLFDLGGDDAPGGTGFDADTVKSGKVRRVDVGGDATRVALAAGVEAGPDGRYATGDDTVVIGSSLIRNVSVGGEVTGVTARADAVLPPTRNVGGINIRAAALDFADPNLTKDVPAGATPIGGGGTDFTHNGVSGTLTFTGPGGAFYDADQGRVILADSGANSSLTVDADGALSGFDIVSGDEDALGLLDVNVPLSGGSAIAIDTGIGQLQLVDLRGGSTVTAGETIGTASLDRLAGGFLEARAANSVSIAGNFGRVDPGVTGEAAIDLVRAGPISVDGATRARLNVARGLASLNSAGPIERSLIRVGDSLGGDQMDGQQGVLTAPSISQSRISVANRLGPVAVEGEVFDSAFMIGGDLGADADFGGVGINADEVSSGTAAGFEIGGGFAQSDLVAGYLRGPDGFFGTPDDAVASGRSVVGDVAIEGSEVGSSRNTESYLIASTGTLGDVQIGGRDGSSEGNFEIRVADTLPTPIRVDELDVSQESRIYTARLVFNQDMDASTLSSALTVREVRGQAGSTEIFLIEGRDYTLSYDDQQQAALVRFERDVTASDLPQSPGEPGPGLYRFVLDGDQLRAQVSGARLDGDGDGFARAGDDYSADTFVGDVGDKLVNNIARQFDGGSQAFRADFRAPGSLDVALDNNFNPDGVADANTEFTINGTIGDHPDHDNDFFSFASDVDVYTITLQAGQILRLGQPQGAARLAPITVFGPSGAGTDSVASTQDLLSLPVNPLSDIETTTERAFHARSTGLYTIAVGSALESGFSLDLADSVINSPDAVPNLVADPNTVGEYSFSVEVFDDGNSGFNEPVDSGSAQNLVDAPEPSRFTGPDGQFGTGDDPSQVTVGGSVFTLNPGPDGQLGTGDDVVSGGNGEDVTSTRSGGTVTTTVNATIGGDRPAGLPGEVFSDLDVFALNNDRPIQPGTPMRLTIKLAEFGGDLGSRSGDLGGGDQQLAFQDFTGQVQFGLFDTTDAEGLADADLVFSPSDFSPNGGTPGVIAANANNQYGFDDNGDFFIEFVAPGRIEGDGSQAATYAAMVQGAFNSDYSLEVATLGGPVQFQQQTQNVFIETNGGSIDWLEVAGQITELEGFDPGVLGLVGSATNGQPIDEFILDGVMDNLERIYDGVGVDVNFSTNPADFEFEDFSTVYLSSSTDPVSDIFEQVGAGVFGFQDLNLGSNAPFGFAEHVDPLNTDSTDEAAVFLPTFSNLGRTPAPSDVDALIESISAAVGRHVGELLGLRITGDTTGLEEPALFDTLAANSVENVPGQGEQLTIPMLDRTISDPFDSVDGTDFWIGEQDSGSLLNRILSPA